MNPLSKNAQNEVCLSWSVYSWLTNLAMGVAYPFDHTHDWKYPSYSTKNTQSKTLLRTTVCSVKSHLCSIYVILPKQCTTPEYGSESMMLFVFFKKVSGIWKEIDVKITLLRYAEGPFIEVGVRIKANFCVI